jgi:hypothetical protein
LRINRPGKSVAIARRVGSTDDKKEIAMKIKGTILGLAALAAFGCTGELTGGETEGTMERTIVHRHADGTETVTTEEISAEEAQAEVAAREALAQPGHHTEAVSLDKNCAGASTWLWDQTVQHGNEICFYSDGTYGPGGGGFIDLSKYCRIHGPVGYNGLSFCYAWWGGAVRSYWSGSQGGYFEKLSTGCHEYFGTYVRNDYAGYCAQSADTFVLNPIIN